MKPSLLIVGLGNPGAQYEDTRHNVGFRAVEKLAEELGTSLWEQKQKFASDILEARVVAVPILLAKPTTFMNRTGEAIAKLVQFYGLDPETHILVICDDIDLPPGTTRVRGRGGAGTHNGLRSIVDHIGEAFPRLRIGIGSPLGTGGSATKAGEDLSAYVLSRPTEEERKKIEDALATVPEIVRAFVLGMQRHER